MSTPLILASSSQYRQALLKKLAIPFESYSADIDETPLVGESPQTLVQRLATEKSLTVASKYTKGLVIGSDQVAVIDGDIVGKPLTYSNAVKQLTAASGKSITFYTGICLHNIETNYSDTRIEPFTVHFRELNKQQIDYYLTTEQPYYCAGSFKSEGLGIALFNRLEGRDPNTLIGLPLILLIDMLAKQGLTALSDNR